MDIEVDTESLTPVYEQIVQQVTQGVLSGRLTAGDSLPSIRQLAGDLMLNPNTVAKAYRQLEGQRVIVTAGRKGTRIRDKADTQITRNNDQDAQFQLDELVHTFRARGMEKIQIFKLLTYQMSLLEE